MQYVSTALDGDVAAETPRERDFLAVQVDADNAAPVGLEQLDSELTDQSQADDREDFPQGRLRDANSLQRDRTDRHERRSLVVNPVRYANREVMRNQVDLGVISNLCAGASHALSHGESRDAFADCDDAADAAIAERVGLIELVEDGAPGCDEPIATDSLDDLPDQIGSFARLSQQRLARQVHGHPLRSYRHERGRGLHEDASGLDSRCRHIGNLQLPCTIRLQNLLHSPIF